MACLHNMTVPAQTYPFSRAATKNKKIENEKNAPKRIAILLRYVQRHMQLKRATYSAPNGREERLAVDACAVDGADGEEGTNDAPEAASLQPPPPHSFHAPLGR